MTKPIRLITLAPGHFHAALVQKQMNPGVHRRAHVYAPLDTDTLAHLDRVTRFNTRPDNPTSWEIDLRASTDWRERFAREQPGNVVVLSGRNRPKIDLLRLAVGNALHVLADKPWVIEAADFPKLEELFADADLREVLVWDVMTERHEVTNRLQRELVRDPEIFGYWQAGSAARPALTLESVHHLKKHVDGRPLARPWWWFDPTISGEAMADVGTHLADLAIWLVAGDNAIDYRSEVVIHTADRWPLLLSLEQFRAVTGLPDYPDELARRVVGGQLYYAGNNSVGFTLCGVHVALSTRWEYEAPAGGGDTHESVARGTKARVAVRQTPGARPELYAAPTDPADHSAFAARLRAKCEALQPDFPGVAATDLGPWVQVRIPDELRTGHESHFAAVLGEFVGYFQTPRAVPPWARPNTLAKYFITTQAVELARQNRPGW